MTMAMEGNTDRLAGALADVRELEEFLFALLPAATASRPKQGDDLVSFAKEQGLAVPAVLEGMEITWDGSARLADDDLGDAPAISLIRPGNPEALGFTIGCIRIGRRIKVCLECGWLYCKIVIKGTF
jgi:hypothetical protein